MTHHRTHSFEDSTAGGSVKRQSILEKSGQALFVGDMLSVIIAFVFGGGTAWFIDVHVLHTGFQKLLSIETFQQFLIFVGLGAASLLWLDSKGHYRQRQPYWEAVGQIVKFTIFGFIVGGFIQFALKNDYSRLWLGLSWMSLSAFILISRAAIQKKLKRQDCWFIPAVFIGDGPLVEQAKRLLQHDQNMGYRIGTQYPARIIDTLICVKNWQAFYTENNCQHVFLALQGDDSQHCENALKALARSGFSYSLIPPWMGLPASTLSPHHFMLSDVLLMHNTPNLTLFMPRLIKRSFDILASATVLILAFPAFAALAYGVTRDGGPVFYKQKRVGLNGKLFSCYKFRSMRVNADAILAKTLGDDLLAAQEWQQFQKLKNDPRITPFGHFIRRWSLDELPQLFNVLRGDMSLVGPRPIMQEQEFYYGPDFSYYRAVRPGITGPWQVSGRNQLTMQERVTLESGYVRNWFFWMDIVIILKTFPVLLKKDQAF